MITFPGGNVDASVLRSVTPERSTLHSDTRLEDVGELELIRFDCEADPGEDGPYTDYGITGNGIPIAEVTHYRSRSRSCVRNWVSVRPLVRLSTTAHADLLSFVRDSFPGEYDRPEIRGL